MKKCFYTLKYNLFLALIIFFAISLTFQEIAIAYAVDNESSSDSNSDLSNYVDLISTTPRSIVLEFSPPEPEFDEVFLDSGKCQNVAISGLENNSEIGKPTLPVQGVMLGIPNNGQPHFEILSSETTPLIGSYNLCPSQRPITEPGFQELNITPTMQYEPIEKEDALFPSTPIEFGSQGYIRYQKYTTIQFHPIQYNSLTGALVYINRIKVRINFNQPAYSFTNAALSFTDTYFEDNYRQVLINYEQAKAWRLTPTAPIQIIQDLHTGQDKYKIIVNQDGMYKLTYDDFEDAGIPFDSLDPRTIKIFLQDEEIAIHVEGQDDGIFNESDFLVFYGEKVNTRYTDENVYWLSFGAENGLRMEEIDGNPSETATIPNEFLKSIHLEKNLEYFWDTPSGSDNDHWYWKVIYGSDSEELQFELNNLSSTAHVLNLKGLIRHYYSSPIPHIRIYINSNPTPIFDDNVSTNPNFNISTSLLQSDLIEGTNTLTIETTSAADNILINWFDLDYYDRYYAENDQLIFEGDVAGVWEFNIDGFSSNSIHAFNLSNPLAPIMINNGQVTTTGNGYQLEFDETIVTEQQYIALSEFAFLTPVDFYLDTPSYLKSTDNEADYIFISPADFMTAIQPLVDYRASQDYEVALVDIEDIYDEFNGGVFNPEAINAFLAYAYANWVSPAPSFVLLVGDGHWDYKDVFETGTENFIPPFLADIDPWLGETATDNAYVSVSGADNLPDMYIGRFPVNSSNEAQSMVQKVLNYEQSPPESDWNLNLTFIADDADSGGDYAQESEDIIAIIPPAYTSNQIYYKVNYSDASLARSALIEDINSGRFIVHYAGHAAYTKWSGQDLFRIADLSTLTNSDAYPFIIPMTCLDGYFIYPGIASLGESFVRLDGAGAIASFSPTGYGLTSGHSVLDESIFNNLFNAYHKQLGYLTTQAKYDLYTTLPSQSYLVDTYLLFGDPALNLDIDYEELNQPTGLETIPSSVSQIDLSWIDNATSETSYLIERSPNGISSWIQIASVDPNITTYSNTGLNPDETWHYRVRAYRAGDDQYSGYSNINTATTYDLPLTPTGLIATPVSTSQIDLTWVDNATDETAYFVERSADGDSGWSQFAELGADTTTFSDTALDPNVTWYYRVRAYRAGDGQYSAYSNIHNAKTENLIFLFLPLIVN